VVFLKFLGVNVKYSHLNPKKALLIKNDVVWRILRKNPFKGVRCSFTEASPKKTKNKCPGKPVMRQSHVLGEKKQ